ncbi:hypothetical protein QA649_29950 [Bradyrhizobium sp. CB1717]|uniref:hypothetical protein n=1 Tax=Bradyrhizobium sp. CB1717 TaxID=3039154 RepID=UPI0024B19E39|nr:hypothetical protein [Bradyrhizobium sp. CB1717]WFU22288.1 hypothetical protein QA649_29950 [Bradyrhizobium sp. CB1717]
MSLSIGSQQMDANSGQTESIPSSDHLRAWLPLILATTAYLILVGKIGEVLRDADTYWHVVVGEWIVDHRAVPHVDPFSFTKHGAPWITSAWLSEVLYFLAFKLAGWLGPALLAAFAASTAFFLLARCLLKRLSNVPVMILVSAGIVMTVHHVLARPHVLIFPLMVLWVDGLLRATETRRAPPLSYVLIITLWANLHGSFTLGVALIAPFALEAVWNADKSSRMTVALHWFRFGVLALGAGCVTPYGVESILVTTRILRLGPILATIGEWRPIDFGSLHPFTICLLGGAAYALYSGFKLPFLRMAALLALVYETLAHQRYVDVFAMVAPFLIAGPLAQHVLRQEHRKAIPARTTHVITFFVALSIATGVIVVAKDRSLPLVPGAAVEKLKELKADRVLNDYYFGGYLIFQRMPTFIDSRAELYGPEFISRYMRVTSLEDLPDFIKLLDEYKIDSTLLFPTTPAVGLLDRLPEWERVYSDNVAVVHVRRTRAESVATPK